MTLEGEVKAIRAVARRMRGATRADARQLAGWAKALEDSARALERHARFLREIRGNAPSSPESDRYGSGLAREAPDRPGPAQKARAARSTSAAAADSVEPRMGTQRLRILDAIYAVSRDPALVGLTDVELAASTGIRPNSLRPRRGELVDGGWLEDSGRTRVHHGNPHVVWVLSRNALDFLTGGLPLTGS